MTFILILTEYSSSIQYASFNTFKAKIGRLFTPQSTFVVENSIDFATFSLFLDNDKKPLVVPVQTHPKQLQRTTLM